MTGHPLDFACTDGEYGTIPGPAACFYYKIAADVARNGSTLPLLILDRDSTGDGAAGSTDLARSPLEAVTSLNLAYSGDASTAPTASSPPYVVEDPQGLQPTIINGASPSGITTSSKWSTTPLVNRSGQPLWSAIIVASDASCGGCDLDDWPDSTLDSDAINARSDEIHAFFNAGGGLLYLAGACDALDAGGALAYGTCAGGPFTGRDVYYASVPVPVESEPASPKFAPTFEGQALGLTFQGVNCCGALNSFAAPAAGSPLTPAEFDSAAHDESLFISGAATCTAGACDGLTMSETADSATVAAGREDGYTIKISNPTASVVTVTSIRDVLAAGFTYLADSSSEATLSDPTISRQTLTWNGSFPVPPTVSIMLHFVVRAPSSPGGPFDGSASALASGVGVMPTGPTAPVTVIPGIDTTPPECLITSITRGDPQTETVAVQDAGSGLASIFGIDVVNGTVTVPPFAAGTTSRVVVTATKADQSQKTFWSFYAKDEAGNVRSCH